MPSDAFVAQLNEQIGHEYGAHQQYVACAVHYDAETLPQLARHEGDYSSEQFMQWFIKEQIEEVATMSDLLRVVERSRDHPMDIEDYLAREQIGAEDEDPTAPHPA